MFKKKVTIFKKKDRETWERIRKILKEEGFKGVKASHYFADVVANGGCGAKLDPRNFGAKGTVDRDIYYVEVRKEDADRARQALRSHVIVPFVDEEAAVDAAERKRSLF